MRAGGTMPHSAAVILTIGDWSWPVAGQLSSNWGVARYLDVFVHAHAHQLLRPSGTEASESLVYGCQAIWSCKSVAAFALKACMCAHVFLHCCCELR